MRPKYHLEIIERYEGVAQSRNLENISLTSPRKMSIIGDASGKSSVIRRKSVAKGPVPRPSTKGNQKGFLGATMGELIIAQMGGIEKMFDHCSQEFFIALEDELGKALFRPASDQIPSTSSPS